MHLQVLVLGAARAGEEPRLTLHGPMARLRSCACSNAGRKVNFVINARSQQNVSKLRAVTFGHSLLSRRNVVLAVAGIPPHLYSWPSLRPSHPHHQDVLRKLRATMESWTRTSLTFSASCAVSKARVITTITAFTSQARIPHQSLQSPCEGKQK